MKLIFLSIFISLSLANPVNVNHDFHFSKCLLEYKPAEEILQVSWHIFLDDVEQAIENQGVEKLFLCTEREHEKGESYFPISI